MTIGERLQMVIKMHNLTNSSFADKIGVQRSSISHVLSGRNKPSVDFLQKILTTFPKVDANWLVNGKQMSQGVSQEQAVSPPSLSIRQKEAVKEEEQAEYTLQQEKEENEPRQSVDSTRKIKKIVIFYSDGTFEEIEK